MGLELPTVEEIRARLADRNLRVVAEAIGVHPNSLYNFKSGRGAPRYMIMRDLLIYLSKT
jgi:gamma-glutamylcysteine synthetase